MAPRDLRGPRSAGSGGPVGALVLLAALLLLAPGGAPPSVHAAVPLSRDAGPSSSTGPAGAVGGTPAATYIWSNRSSSPAPSPRGGAGLAYDPDLGAVVLFGGWNGSSTYADTWTYLGGSWTELPLAVHPSPRWGMAMSWDPTDREIVLFGGWNWTGTLNDTWAFRAGSWSLLHPTLTPLGRDLAACTWDGADGYVLLYGGLNVNALNDTWSFVGGNWTPVHPTLSPPARTGPGMAYSPHDGDVMLTEGEANQYRYDVWTYVGGQWTNVTTAAGGPAALPAVRDGLTEVYDAASNLTIFTLGEHLGTYENDTWTWQTPTFTQIHPSVAPEGLQYAAAAWDAADGYLVVFGGDHGPVPKADTWVWGPPLPLSLVGDAVTPTTLAVEATAFYTTWASGGVPPYSFAWQFGDGTGTGLSRVTHAYSWPGTYQANLTVTDATGNTARATFSLQVSWGSVAAVTASASATPTSGFAPLAVTFAGSAQGGYPGYVAAWRFGDGTGAPGWNVSHSYAQPGTYTATLTATDRAGVNGSSTLTILVQALPPPPPPLALTASATPQAGTAPLTVTFSGYAQGGVPGYAYTWTFGDGTAAYTTNTTHPYTVAGSYTATLTVHDQQGHTLARSFGINVTENSSTGPGGSGLFGLPGDEGYLLLVGAIAAVVVVAVVAVLLLRRHPPEGDAYGSYPPSSRGAPGWPPDGPDTGRPY